MENYDVGQLIGEGGFASVYYAFDRKRDLEVAIKILDKKNFCDPGALRRMENEIRVHFKLFHPFIVCPVDASILDSSACLVLELCRHGNMFTHLRNVHQLNQFETTFVVKQVLSAIQYLHDNGFVHRDLKLSNILISEVETHAESHSTLLHVKLCDFGLTVQVNHPDEDNITLCGTPHYIAPEVLLKEDPGKPADIWSIGCIYYILRIGQPILDSESIQLWLSTTLSKQRRDELVNQIIDRVHSAELSAVERDFLLRTLHAVPQQRPSAQDLLQHPLFAHINLESNASSHYDGDHHLSSTMIPAASHRLAPPTINQHPMHSDSHGEELSRTLLPKKSTSFDSFGIQQKHARDLHQVSKSLQSLYSTSSTSVHPDDISECSSSPGDLAANAVAVEQASSSKCDLEMRSSRSAYVGTEETSSHRYPIGSIVQQIHRLLTTLSPLLWTLPDQQEVVLITKSGRLVFVCQGRPVSGGYRVIMDMDTPQCIWIGRLEHSSHQWTSFREEMWQASSSQRDDSSSSSSQLPELFLEDYALSNSNNWITSTDVCRQVSVLQSDDRDSYNQHICLQLTRVVQLLEAAQLQVPRVVYYCQARDCISRGRRRRLSSHVTSEIISVDGRSGCSSMDLDCTMKCMLMSNFPLPHFKVQWSDKSRLLYDPNAGQLTVWSPSAGSKWTGTIAVKEGFAEGSWVGCQVPEQWQAYVSQAQCALQKCMHHWRKLHSDSSRESSGLRKPCLVLTVNQ